MKNTIKNTLVFPALLVFGSSFLQTSIAAKTKEPVRIIVNDWTSQIALSKITGSILSDVGYKIKYVNSKSNGQWFKLKNNQADIQVEVWQGTMAKKYNQLIKTGDIVDAGNHAAKTREDWWYPEYVEKQCPGLPDWKALKKCYKIFATSKTKPKGMYLGGPWEKPDRARIRALKMNFKVIQVKNGDALWVELEKAAKEERPIVLFNWTPNWVEAKYKGKFVEFPKYSPKCISDPKWGENSKYPWDCGNPKDGWLKKIARTEFSKEQPCAFELLKNINFTNAMISNIAAAVDADKMSYDEAAQQWLDNNKKLWHSWIPATCSKIN
ncbi:Glycine betaine/carnitine transport binding protein GbuC precursor [Piscirickettsia salmonis]|uniref:ABC transporter substrate-binding protein n=1 Tax=Piscirickettsia salmonis TaxID=1238 RepID=UPI0012B7B067|nr:ABC transporter substrate-binding protein [Piscirickettsia salmonis]QGP50145.1 Glycine betaine/carnitine transport binding protein GbuC precursor [Piscirickettsia salmonis]QGP54804.1 Glycine betaine/carnitine transport binding protein GbuC precursor [Piscirickettsia salmonis]QGP59304.1 Glycine betaine/carnitine transport binding protein GbuC precursor [Piscirickettsia salmonis]QGP64008.1 Glycine betaine/carnitine transport binding protein GbuC precursor [Piscirickettsia salmonis]